MVEQYYSCPPEEIDQREIDVIATKWIHQVAEGAEKTNTSLHAFLPPLYAKHTYVSCRC